MDENDCPPVIQAHQVGSVNESSAAGILSIQYICDWAECFLTVLNCIVSFMLVISRYGCDESDSY